MPILQEEPLTKVTLNLFTKDVEYLKQRTGLGYTVVIRDVVRTYCRTSRQHDARRKELWQTRSMS